MVDEVELDELDVDVGSVVEVVVLDVVDEVELVVDEVLVEVDEVELDELDVDEVSVVVVVDSLVGAAEVTDSTVVLGETDGPVGSSPERTPPMAVVLVEPGRPPVPVVALVISCSVVVVGVTASSPPRERSPSRMTTVAMAAAATTPSTA